MEEEEEQVARFDRWAERYDHSVRSRSGFPFAGYEQVLDRVVALAAPGVGGSVLDLGTGTGALAGRFLERGCAVWGTDFSPTMLARARENHPNGRFGVARLETGLPPEFPRQYASIVSAYALHHLSLSDRTALIHRLVKDHLAPGGLVVIADIAFATRQEREACHAAWREAWDESEHYWAADETLESLGGSGVGTQYGQVSFCAGVFAFKSEIG